jgi:hypothetical protein
MNERTRSKPSRVGAAVSAILVVNAIWILLAPAIPAPHSQPTAGLGGIASGRTTRRVVLDCAGH